MQEKNPFAYPLLTYAWVLGLAATGGLIAALKKDQNLKKTFVDVMASALAGLITFWFCEANGINPLYSAIFIAVNGHLGTKALKKFSDWFGDKFLGDKEPQKVIHIYKNKNGETTRPTDLGEH